MLKKKLGTECIEKRIINCHISWFYKVPSTLVIPEGCRWIRSEVFSNCSKLKKVIIPGSVKEIKNWAFLDCRKLKKVVISEGVESISRGAFYNCIKLEEVEIPKSVEVISDGAFYRCESAVIILEKPKREFRYISSIAFEGCKDVKKEIRN